MQHFGLGGSRTQLMIHNYKPPCLASASARLKCQVLVLVSSQHAMWLKTTLCAVVSNESQRQNRVPTILRNRLYPSIGAFRHLCSPLLH